MANETVNKVTLGSETLVDLTDTTATAEDVAQGKVFYAASGARTLGTASGGSGASVFYGTCATAAATAAKAVECEEFTSANLVEGTVLNVKFTNAQTYNGAPTLNVQSTGAKNIKRVGTTNAARYEWVAGEVLQFVYDGSYWMLTDGGIATTTYYGVTKLSNATNSTSTALAATANAVKLAYDHADGKQDALVSGTNIKTINGTSLLGSGDISTAELPSVSSSDDGKVLTVANGAWAAGTASGGGSVSVLTLYTDKNYSNLWVDSAATTTFLESVDYSYQDGYDRLHDADKVIVERTDNKTSSKMYAALIGVFYDKVDETFNVSVVATVQHAALKCISCS